MKPNHYKQHYYTRSSVSHSFFHSHSFAQFIYHIFSIYVYYVVPPPYTLSNSTVSMGRINPSYNVDMLHNISVAFIDELDKINGRKGNKRAQFQKYRNNPYAHYHYSGHTRVLCVCVCASYTLLI